jgi:Acyclic terpene utilisation family protein AtuA
VAADGSAVIAKHPDTGGLVSVGTVTAQLLYEIAEPAYANPDVIAHFDTARLAPDGPDRVRISGTRGSPPPPTAKVAMNLIGGFRNTMTLVLTGLDIEEKAAWARQELFGVLGGEDQFEEVDVRLLRFDTPDAPTNEQATAHLRITVKDADPRKVGRRFSNATMELALGGYAGFHTTTPPSAETAFGVYWPALVPADVVQHAVVLPDGSTVAIPPATPARFSERSDLGNSESVVSETVAFRESAARPGQRPAGAAEAAGIGPDAPTRRVALGLVCGARSGDKGGNANVGLWTRDPAAYPWLRDYLTVGRLRELLTEAADLDVRRYELPNLSALNFVIAGLLGQGVAASTRPDPQAKGLGEYLRSRLADVPLVLLGGIDD